MIIFFFLKNWYRHTVILKCHTLELIGNSESNDETLSLNEDDPFESPSANNDSLENEIWFHSELRNRRAVENLINNSMKPKNGLFLVRPSGKFQGQFALSFLRNGEVNHCIINESEDRKFFLTQNHKFNSLQDLIRHYSQNPLKTNAFHQSLTEPIPQYMNFIGQP